MVNKVIRDELPVCIMCSGSRRLRGTVAITGTTTRAVSTDDGAGQEDQEAQVAVPCKREQILTGLAYPVVAIQPSFQGSHFVQRKHFHRIDLNGLMN